MYDYNNLEYYLTEEAVALKKISQEESLKLQYNDYLQRKRAKRDIPLSYSEWLKKKRIHEKAEKALMLVAPIAAIAGGVSLNRNLNSTSKLLNKKSILKNKMKYELSKNVSKESKAKIKLKYKSQIKEINNRLEKSKKIETGNYNPLFSVRSYNPRLNFKGLDIASIGDDYNYYNTDFDYYLIEQNDEEDEELINNYLDIF